MSNKEATIKLMDIKEFVELGLLQEVNRLFFHPRGLALQVTVSDDGSKYRLDGVWDYREDPEGICFGNLDPKVSNRKAVTVQQLLDSKAQFRQQNLGYVIQPLPWESINE